VASKRFDLLAEARQFADTLSGLLNATVCGGVRLRAVIRPTGDAMVGYKITKTDYTPQRAFRLGTSGLFCGLSYRLQPDDEGDYLTVGSSFAGLFGDERMVTPLLHFDYERGKADGYPEAHLQVDAASPTWETVLGRCDATSDRKRALKHLHLPVGGVGSGRLLRT
jgi:hypothetical protein